MSCLPWRCEWDSRQLRQKIWSLKTSIAIVQFSLHTGTPDTTQTGLSCVWRAMWIGHSPSVKCHWNSVSCADKTNKIGCHGNVHRTAARRAKQVHIMALCLFCFRFVFIYFCDFSQTNYLNIYRVDLRQIFTFGRTTAVDERPEVGFFSIPQGTLRGNQFLNQIQAQSTLLGSRDIR